MNDLEFISQIQNGSFEKTQFTHLAHLRLAWFYCMKYQNHFEQAVEAVRAAIKSYTRHQGLESIYHETLTRIWVMIVYQAAYHNPSPSFEIFLKNHLELLNTDLPLMFYTPDVLYHTDAKQRWVQPNRKPLELP